MTDTYLFVLDTMADGEPGHLTPELNTGRFCRHPGTRVPVRTVGPTRDPVTTMGGVRLLPDLALAELTPAGPRDSRHRGRPSRAGWPW